MIEDFTHIVGSDIFIPATPCDENGHDLPPNTPPTPLDDYTRIDDPAAPDAWAPFDNCRQFDFAYFHFIQCKTSAKNINQALDMWAAQVIHCGGDPNDEFPWKNARDLYASIDEIRHGGSTKWASYEVQYQGPLPADGPPPKWMSQKFELCV